MIHNSSPFRSDTTQNCFDSDDISLHIYNPTRVESCNVEGSSVYDFFGDGFSLLSLPKSWIRRWSTYFFTFRQTLSLRTFLFFWEWIVRLQDSVTPADRSFCHTHNLSSTPSSVMRKLSPTFVSRLSKPVSVVPFFLSCVNIQMELITQTQYIFSYDHIPFLLL